MRPANIIILLLLTCVAGPVGRAAEPTPLDEAACRAAFAALPRPAILRAEFTQEKSLPEVAKPLRTRGELLVSAQDGVILRTLQPAFAQGTRVIPLLRPGRAPANLEARIGQTIQAVLAGDFKPLAEFFTATGQRTGDQLTVTLTPKTPQVKEVISRLTFRFGAHLDEVAVEEATGGRIRLAFSNFREGPAPTAEELQGFASAR
jgi:hypothetical protein